MLDEVNKIVVGWPKREGTSRGFSKDQFARPALQTQVNDAGLSYKVSIEAA